MCMIDDAESGVVLHQRHHIARQKHQCSECWREIQSGESYMTERTVFDGEAQTHKTCLHCQIVREWLTAECGGFVYGAVEEDIREHADEGDYGFDVKKLAIGMSRSWKRRDGRMWPIPRQPKTTEQRMAAANSAGARPNDR